MIFTSYLYIGFLVAAFAIHWLLPTSWRKAFLVFGSYFFYCSWRWEFGFLLLGVTLFNWSYARWVLANKATRARLTLGIVVNLCLLLYFKYTYFLLSNTLFATHAMGLDWDPTIPRIVLPLGISFFTFQGVAYLFDVATGEQPMNKLLDFMLFKSFWPQLIAGPIVRIHEMRDQIATPRTLNYADVAEGCRRILLGVARKVVIADVLAQNVEVAFRPGSSPNFLDAVAGTLGFAIQIYMDFGAYSDIAIGSARLFGYRFPENFNWPYAASSPQDFWLRWHMTLSRWIRDYIFTPVSFATRNRPQLAPVWLLVAMALCGLWHGAEWTFVLWGVWHGALLALQTLTGSAIFVKSSDKAPRLRSLASIALTFALVCLGWILFRADTLAHAIDFVKAIVTFRGGLRPSLVRENGVLLIAFAVLGVFVAQWLNAVGVRRVFESDTFFARRILRPSIYLILVAVIIVADQEATPFVYFQF